MGILKRSGRDGILRGLTDYYKKLNLPFGEDFSSVLCNKKNSNRDGISIMDDLVDKDSLRNLYLTKKAAFDLKKEEAKKFKIDNLKKFYQIPFIVSFIFFIFISILKIWEDDYSGFTMGLMFYLIIIALIILWFSCLAVFFWLIIDYFKNRKLIKFVKLNKYSPFINKFICSNCLKPVFIEKMEFPCPFCETDYLGDALYLESVLFDFCPHCEGKIQKITCYNCNEWIDLFARYNEEELIRKRYENEQA